MTTSLANSVVPLPNMRSANLTQAERLGQCLRVLTELTQIARNSSDFYGALDLVLKEMLRISQSDSALAVLAGEDGAFQFMGGCNSNGKQFAEDDMWVSAALTARLKIDCEMAYITDVSHDPELSADKDIALQHLRAVIMFRLSRGEALLGVIQLGSHSVLPRLEELELTILQSFAGQLSLILDNALAYSHIDQLKESVETEIAERTEQLSAANGWLANALQTAERQLDAKRETERSLSRILMSTSHEVRAPTQLILGHAYMAIEEGTENLTNGQRSSLAAILKAGEHIRNLASKLADPDQLADGGFPVDPVPFDVRPLINETLTFCRTLTKGQPVQLQYSYPPDLPEVLGDATRIRQVLINLLGNSCRFTKQGKITVSASANADYVVISVADNGAGIAPEKLSAMLSTDFHSAHLSTNTPGGSGMGIPISKHLVELHGGQLWAKSFVGKGSVFSFSLPIPIARPTPEMELDYKIG